MKTFKEKAEYWLNDNVAGWSDSQLQCLTILLKEQDRDTRHKCAEGVLQVTDSSHAHNICINVKGG